ncbi:hypothetical protein ACN47E_004755 [Coniothyrium glycines]
MAPPSICEIVERDEAGNITATYVASGKYRVDVILPEASKSHVKQLLDVFLPAGFPQSVTDDYIQYQIYDSLQAFSSSIAGMLASRAVLEGVGVGDSTASPTAALLLSVLQDSMGRIATILFAHRLGTALEPECKMYRFAADVFNDTAIVLDCLSPAFPKAVRVAILSFSSILRSLCGVCAGSAKASLSAHFARKGNLGEVNAKDSSQETVISLLGMLAGSIVVSWVSTPMATWSTLIALLSIHLATNYAAVRAVSMRCLNRQRANIVFSNMMQNGRVLRPAEVAKRERIFDRDGILRWSDDKIIGRCKIGVSLHTLLSHVGSQRKDTGSLDSRAVSMPALLAVFADEGYIMWPGYSPDDECLIVLKDGCTTIDQLKAWTHALSVMKVAQERSSEDKQEGNDVSQVTARLTEIERTLEETRNLFENYSETLKDQGWDLDVVALGTRPGTTVHVGSRI